MPLETAPSMYQCNLWAMSSFIASSSYLLILQIQSLLALDVPDNPGMCFEGGNSVTHKRSDQLP